MTAVAPPASAKEALAMLESAMGFLCTVDAAQMAAETQAMCLVALEGLEAAGTVARASILGAFTAAQGHVNDADHNPRTWLMNKTRITRGAAAGHVGWARRAAVHPQVAQAMAGREISESFGRTICTWSDKLPEDCRLAADAILIGAARAGMDLRDLAALAAEIRDRSRPDEPDRDRDDGFDDRSVRLETTFGGAGVLHADLTPECAAVVQTVLDALSARAGAEDTRSHPQRYHDALHEALQRLIASGMLPERAGQPVKVWAHISLADLMVLEGSSALQQRWIAEARAAWAAHRAAASAGGGDGAAWLEGDAVGMACDASVTPVVMGNVNLAALDDMVRLCVELDRYRNKAANQPANQPADQAADPDQPAPGPSPAGEALEQAVIGQAVALVSGPGGLASYLRRRQLGARLGGPSLPLDIGFSENIPASIRNAVRLRDRHCQWAGGCYQPAAACQVHHTKHKSRGGKTSLKDCVLLCFFHHQVMIHRMGWTLVVNPDGTTTAWNRDKTKTLRSHSPPARAG